MVVVNVLAFYSEDASSNPDEVYNFSAKLLIRTKINKKLLMLALLKNNMIFSQSLTFFGLSSYFSKNFLNKNFSGFNLESSRMFG